MLVIVGMVIAAFPPMGVLGEGDLPYYDIEKDSLGNYHKAFINNSVGNYEIYYTNDIGGQFPQDWNPPVKISNTTNESLLLDLGIYLRTDTMFIIWVESCPDIHNTTWENQTYYTISRDYGANWAEPRRSYEKIMLRYAEFDPLIGEPIIPYQLLINDTEYYLVQLKTPLYQEWWDGIEDTGGIFCEYIPNNAYLVWMNATIKEKVEQLPYIRWIHYYHPAYKIQPGLQNNSGIIEVCIAVIEETGGQGNLNKTIQAIEDLEGNITYNGSSNFVIRTQIDASKIDDIAFIPEVEWIEEYHSKIIEMDHIRVFTGANYLHIQGIDGEYDGDNIIGGVVDDGIDADHQEFSNTLYKIYGSPPERPHGTNVFGEIFSEGVQPSKTAMGMLPNGRGIFLDFEDYERGSAMSQLCADGGVFLSNSWSMEDDYYGEYTWASNENDNAIFIYDATMVYAAGNGGGQKISSDSAAKNVICVGGMVHNDNEIIDDDEWWTGSCQGPAVDERIKPDLVGPADMVYTTTSGNGYVSNFGGTSAATPIISGAVGLVYQMYKQNHFGNNPVNQFPHASTIKAILIANAYQYILDPSDPNFQATRYQQGWGTVDLKRIFDIGSNHFIVDESEPLKKDEASTYHIYPTSAQDLKISLVWTDPPGPREATQHLKNNLDLKVTDPNGNVYWGNYGLLTSQWSSIDSTADPLNADILNNVENVFIQNPTEGSWAIEVIATDIQQDGVWETFPEIDQAYSLVISPMGQKIWPMFHHNPWHTGFATSNSPETPARLWEFTTGSIVYSSPVHYEGKVFVASSDNILYCLRDIDAQILWTFQPGYYLMASPAISNGKVFLASHLFDRGRVYCINDDLNSDNIIDPDPINGEVEWVYYHDAIIDASLTVAHGKVFVNTYNGIICLDEIGNGDGTTDLIWSYPYTTGSGSWSSPAVAYGKVFAGCTDHNVYAVDENTGEPKWTFQTGGPVWSSPAVANHKVFVGSGVAFDDRVYAIDEDTGTLIWYYDTGGSRILSSPALAYKNVYFGSIDDNKIYCIPQDDPSPGDNVISRGEEKWTSTTDDAVFSSPAVSGDGRVFVASEDGSLYAFKAEYDAPPYDPIWTQDLGGAAGTAIFSSPAIANGNIYIGGSYDGKIWAFTQGT